MLRYFPRCGNGPWGAATVRDSATQDPMELAGASKDLDPATKLQENVDTLAALFARSIGEFRRRIPVMLGAPLRCPIVIPIGSGAALGVGAARSGKWRAR